MQRAATPCKNSVVSRHPAILRALAALLATSLALPGAALAKAPDPLEAARTALGKAAELSRKQRHAEAAGELEGAVTLVTANPGALDEEAGTLLSDALLQLAVERLVDGDEDAGDAALAKLVRLFPEREVTGAEYPPAFLVELAGVRKRLFASPRGSLRVLAPPGGGEARVLVDGHAPRLAPVLVEGLIPGEHFVRVERAGATSGQKVVVIAGVETPVAPQLETSAGPAAPPAESVRRVAVPGAPVPAAEPAPKSAQDAPEEAVVKSAPAARPADEAPSRALVIPRKPAPEETEPVEATPSKAPPAPVAQHLQALEPEAIKTARETPPRPNHTALWIVAGVLVAGAAAAGGYFLYQSSQSPSSANVNATWGH